jgi:hypothetical protein
MNLSQRSNTHLVHMPDLLHTLEGHDLGFLKIVAGCWGIELSAPDAASAQPLLVRALSNRPLIGEMLEALPEAAREALEVLLENEGKLAWALFTRRFGEVRPMGAGRRDRERPDLNPVSAAEVLWYRALIGKAFFNLPPEPQEYAYIPDNLLEYLEPLGSSHISPMGRPASPGECAHPLPVTDRVLDHACTLLAARRMNLKPQTETDGQEIPWHILQDLLGAAGLLDDYGSPVPEAARLFLESERGDALTELAQAWLNSPKFNELRLLPGLKFEGEWQNNALQTRQTVLSLLSQLPEDTWWSLPAFISAIKERRPDFQRPAGDYDSWFIRKAETDTYLRGFSSWDDVDGALLRFLITGPLHWLGILDLAATAEGEQITAFRHSAWAAALWHGRPPALKAEKAVVKVYSDGRLVVPLLTPRSIRYQIARFCLWEGERKGNYHYRLSPTSLEQAASQGLRPAHLTAILKKHSAGPLPPDLSAALERWEKFGVQARMQPVVLLRVKQESILEALQKTRAARYLGERPRWSYAPAVKPQCATPWPSAVTWPML